MFDYETLRFIWWLLIGVILVVFMISDGFDMGIGCLLPLVARNDDERRIGRLFSNSRIRKLSSFISSHSFTDMP